MFKLLEYNDKYRSSWNDFAREKGTIFHTIEWKEVLEETFGYKSIYMMVVGEDCDVVGLIPVLTGRNILMRKIGVSLPFVNHADICCKDPEAFRYIIDKLSDLSNESRLHYLEMRFKEQTLEENITVDKHNYTFILPLDGGEDGVLSLSTGDNRNHVRKVCKNGQFEVSFDYNRLEEFYKVWRKRQKQLGTPDHGIKLFMKIKEKFPDNAFLLSVLEKGQDKVLGGMFLITWKDTVYYPWGGAMTEYNKKHINEFMYWEAVKFGIHNGFKYLDLGRSPYNPDSGTYRAKKKWGAEPVQLKYYKLGQMPGGEHVLSQDKLGIMVSAWKVLPEFITNALGRYLIKYVMP